MGEWRAVPGYEGLYEVSDCGEVRSLVTTNAWRKIRARAIPLVLRQKLDDGYPRVTLFKEGKRRLCLVHRLVLLAFVGEPPEGYQAAHLDGVRTNCRLSNLQWKTQSANESDKLRHGTAPLGEKNGVHRLTEAQVREIRERYRRGVYGCARIARDYGISLSTVAGIVSRKRWSHV